MSPQPGPPEPLRSDAEGVFTRVLRDGDPTGERADVPVTLLLGRGWRGVGRSVRALTRPMLDFVADKLESFFGLNF